MEDGRLSGVHHIGAPALGQLRRLPLRPLDVGHPLGIDHGIGHGTEIGQGQFFHISVGAVQPLAQDVAVDGWIQVFPSTPVGQRLTQLGGGHLHQTGQVDDSHIHICTVGFLQKGTLPVEQLDGVIVIASEGQDACVPDDDLRLMPLVEGQEHIRPHHQPQFIRGVNLAQLLQGVRGVALSCPVHFDIRHLHHVRTVQPVAHDTGHG